MIGNIISSMAILFGWCTLCLRAIGWACYKYFGWDSCRERVDYCFFWKKAAMCFPVLISAQNQSLFFFLKIFAPTFGVGCSKGPKYPLLKGPQIRRSTSKSVNKIFVPRVIVCMTLWTNISRISTYNYHFRSNVENGKRYVEILEMFGRRVIRLVFQFSL